MSGAHNDDDLAVDFATLKRLSSEMEDILADLTEKLETLWTRSEKVVSHWEGEAREVCVDVLDRWDRSMQDLEGAQRWLHDVVTNGHVNYVSAHRAVLRGWGDG
ncbi:WXG100 family type VII secretion target [Streptomyces sp. AA1529]|uniref:WXG100 family type VII secretion target n=1 Tax=Streptomyces sp. AA1529 TaxID=1203257 RepID=UPI0002FB1C28|nr:WXG100 family type VII secretion target [Streptomyces sp. AA1529]